MTVVLRPEEIHGQNVHCSPFFDLEKRDIDGHS